MAADVLDVAPLTSLTRTIVDDEGQREVCIEELAGYAEFFDLIRPVQDPMVILSMCEDQDRDEGLPPGTSIELYRFYLSIAK